MSSGMVRILAGIVPKMDPGKTLVLYYCGAVSPGVKSSNLNPAPRGRHMPKDFDEFVKRQVSEAKKQAEETLDLEKEKSSWISRLHELYKMAKSSLDTYIKDGRIQFALEERELREELLGSYQAPAARITVGRSVVTLEPVATFLIGARGRVDMTGPRGLVRFLIVPRESHGITVRVTVGARKPETSPAKRVDPLKDWVWKIATQPPNVTFVELNEEVFRDSLMKIINGG